mgnify:CR=1 FL=1
MLTTGMIETGKFHLNVVRRQPASCNMPRASDSPPVLGTPICKRERALDGGAVA